MTNEIANINSGNFAEMAQAMGMSSDIKENKSKSSTIPRLRIWNKAVMGQVEVKGKMKNMEVVPCGAFRLQMPDDTFIYAESVDLRVFVQRFMRRRYDADKNIYIKTIMANDLNGDLKDNLGQLNCGKPSGFIKDWTALPKDTKDFFNSIKRVRVMLGEVKLINPVDQQGNEVDIDVQPFIWEIDNKDAFATMGEPFTKMAKERRLPIQHWINCSSEEEKTKSGMTYFLPKQSVNMAVSIDLADDDQQKFADFMEWVNNYNEYIVNLWNEKRTDKMELEDASLVEDFIDIESSGE